jgi:hypothetical protein
MRTVTAVIRRFKSPDLLIPFAPLDDEPALLKESFHFFWRQRGFSPKYCQSFLCIDEIAFGVADASARRGEGATEAATTINAWVVQEPLICCDAASEVSDLVFYGNLQAAENYTPFANHPRLEVTRPLTSPIAEL